MQSRPPSRLIASELIQLGLPALVLLFGLQLLRVLIPGLAWYLRDTVGVTSAVLGVLGLGTFLLGFLAVPLRRLLGSLVFLRLAVGGLAALRLAEQIIRQPAADLALSLLGTVLFLLALPASVAQACATRPQAAAASLAGGWALGLTLDTALKGFAGTLDLSWWRGPLALLVVLIECGAVVWLLRRAPRPAAGALTQPSPGAALTLAGLGPLLFLQLMIYQNLGWMAQVAGLTASAALVLAMMGNLVLAAGVWVGLRRPFALRPLTALLGAVCLALSATVAGQPTSVFTFNVLIAQFVVGWSLAAIALSAAAPASDGLGRTAASLTFGLLIFQVLTFAYYVSLDVRLPVQRSDLFTLAAVAFGLAVVRATTQLTAQPQARAPSAAAFAGAALAFLPALAFALVQPAAVPVAEPGRPPLRILTYNIHSAFNSQGAQDPEAIAGVIEASGADTVALQEVSRGWLLDGSTDLASFLARRLQMQVLFQGTADPVWGNALLTRLPILEHGAAPLPLAGTLLPRGYLWASLDAGLPEPLLVIVTHLHHVESEHAPRLAQVPVLLDFWDRRPYTLLLGDLNSEPGYREMGLLQEAGLLDAWAAAGTGNGLTWPAVDPFERIDWIWHTPDLQPLRAEVLATTASDHLPLLAEFVAAP
jgi:endonuclease/exonuclease/phosphatase family metal-dependent hydrolase